MSLILSVGIRAFQSPSRAMPCRPTPADPPSVSKYQPPHPPTVEDAERKGRLRPGGVIVEGTRGNTGISLALASLAKGYQCVLVVPDSVSAVKVDLMRAYGAHVHVQPSVPLSDSRHFYHKVSLLSSFPPSLPPSLPRSPPVPLLPPARKHGDVGEAVPRRCRRRFSGQSIPYKAYPGPSHTGQGGVKGLSGWRWGREEDASCLRLSSGPYQPSLIMLLHAFTLVAVTSGGREEVPGWHCIPSGPGPYSLSTSSFPRPIRLVRMGVPHTQREPQAVAQGFDRSLTRALRPLFLEGTFLPACFHYTSVFGSLTCPCFPPYRRRL